MTNLHAATAAHLDGWREARAGGAERIGWKIGLNVRAAQERAGIDEPIVGHLTSAGVLADGGEFSLAGAVNPMVEPEVAVRVDRSGAITAIAPAIEVVDMDADIEDIEPVLAGNIFHRAVVFGDEQPLPEDGLPAAPVRVTRGDALERETDLVEAAGDVRGLVDLVARTLAAHDEALESGERIICGTLTPPVAPRPGDTIVNDLGPLGRVTVTFTA